MSLLDRIISPHRDKSISQPIRSGYLFNYRRIWRGAVLLMGSVALLPLIVITAIDYQVTQHAIESDFLLRTTRIVSNNNRNISFFLSERKSALDFIVHENSFKELARGNRLATILSNLKISFGSGFADLGVIDDKGVQMVYEGPYNLQGKDYSDQEWYRQVVEKGVHISDVFLGYRNVPHMVIAVKNDLPGGSFFILRSAIGIEIFENILSNLELAGDGDAFLINHEGILQTSSKYYGAVLDKLPLDVPDFSPESMVYETGTLEGKKLLIGYRFIDQSPFILMVVKDKKVLMESWSGTRIQLILFLIFSITVITTVILGTATYLVRKMKIADERRLSTFHQVEYANKMASIGRLAASVAHEINNPLAIINEKAGLIKDLFVIKKQYSNDEKLIGLVDSIIRSVTRTGIITKRLLSFARNLQARIEPVNLKETIQEVLGFMDKEAQFRQINIALKIDENIPVFESDRGKLQQVFLNLINNAFAAVDDGGKIEINAEMGENNLVLIMVEDNGCGIAREDLKKIFEPFFSTKTGQGGTGLGLSITYNLVMELGGTIQVSSEMNKGTVFTISIPLNREKKNEQYKGTSGG
ncbi:MAG: ATP-binding protein [Deltaproteobacteria bacterium]|nr:ATP-binding protein [Deltaproteobacteria bacterium]